MRPVVGVPAFVAGTMAVVVGVPFNPMEPVLQMDPPILVAIGALLTGVLTYQVGAALGQILWRAKDLPRAKSMDLVRGLRGWGGVKGGEGPSLVTLTY